MRLAYSYVTFINKCKCESCRFGFELRDGEGT